MSILALRHFPQTRLRRLRQSKPIRNLICEHKLDVKDLIWPVFIREETGPAIISSMPDVRRYTIKELLVSAHQAMELGISAIALFPLIAKNKKTDDGSEALNPDNLMCKAIKALKKDLPEMIIIADVAFDPYTTHGHDGIISQNSVANDATVRLLCLQAVNQAAAGADIIAPSDMMDGRIKAIRKALDEAGYSDKPIMSYAAKYASAFYGPFREAVGVLSLQGPLDKKSYQMDPANHDEALHEIALDINEGADMIIVKPGLPYLDVIQSAKQNFKIPVFAYQVSGEYSMLKAAAQNGWLDYEACLMESLLAMKRAGANGILTYGALDAARIIK